MSVQPPVNIVLSQYGARGHRWMRDGLVQVRGWQAPLRSRVKAASATPRTPSSGRIFRLRRTTQQVVCEYGDSLQSAGDV